jgi:hypothetical protein
MSKERSADISLSEEKNGTTGDIQKGQGLRSKHSEGAQKKSLWERTQGLVLGEDISEVKN